MFSLLNFEKEFRNELLEYLKYLNETTAELVNILSEKFQVTYESLASASTDTLKDIANYYDGLGLSW